MSANDENIIWDENPSIKLNFPTQKAQQPEKKIIEEKEYSSLYEELKDKLNPENYMGDNYDAEKLGICNKLYSQLLTVGSGDSLLKNIRNEAIDKLQLHFSSKRLYKELSEYCDPKQFMNPYNKEMLNLANECYKYVQDNKDNILGLESLYSLVYYKQLIKEREKAKEREKIIKHDKKVAAKNQRRREREERQRRERIERENAIKEFKIHKLIDKKVKFYTFLFNCAGIIFWLLTFVLFTAVIFVLIYQWNYYIDNDTDEFSWSFTKECLFGLLYIGLYAGIIALLWQVVRKIAAWYLKKREQAKIKIDMSVLDNIGVEELKHKYINWFEVIVRYIIATIFIIIIGGIILCIIPLSFKIWSSGGYLYNSIFSRIVAQLVWILSCVLIVVVIIYFFPFGMEGNHTLTDFFDEWEKEDCAKNRFKVLYNYTSWHFGIK